MPKEQKAMIPGSEDSHMRISVLVYAIAAVLVGLLSLSISQMMGNMLTVLAALILAWVAGRVVQLLVGRRDAKWLLGNGVIIYLFIWLVSWIFFFNLLG